VNSIYAEVDNELEYCQGLTLESKEEALGSSMAFSIREVFL
jgi:hypothetical protein